MQTKLQVEHEGLRSEYIQKQISEGPSARYLKAMSPIVGGRSLHYLRLRNVGAGETALCKA